MGLIDRVWGALTATIKLDDKVNRQGEAMKSQQQKVEDLTARVIRLEAQLELLTSAALMKRLKADWSLNPAPSAGSRWAPSPDGCGTRG